MRILFVAVIEYSFNRFNIYIYNSHGGVRMNWYSLFLAQMSQLASSKGILYSVIAALLVPIVYGGILLSPDWGPYDNLSNLPVAVVNNDKGALSGDEPLNVGEDLVADLKKSNDLGWKFVDSDEADKGLKALNIT